MSKKKVTKKAPTRKVGRPTKYKPEYCQKIIEYFNVDYFITTYEQKMSASGAVEDIEVIKPNRFRTLAGFAARELGVDPDTLKEWRDKYPDFSAAYRQAKAIQRDMINAHAMSGGYNASFAKFMLVNNHNMKDKSEVVSENTNHNNNSYGLAFDLSKSPEELEKENS
jgi:hypothetical protein